jgi:phosphatidate cytidylyltransferase
MLKLRILSTLVLIPLVLWALFAWPPAGFAGFIGMFILAGAWEWSALAGQQGRATRFVYVGTVGIGGILVFLNPAWTMPLLLLAAMFWLWAFVELLTGDGRDGFLASQPGRLLSGLLVLVSTWVAIVSLRQLPQGEWLSLFLYLLIWGADIGAYFAGHHFGRHKLAPAISPGKTWEGVAGGLAIAVVLALGTGLLGWKWQGWELVFWLALAIATMLISVLGDLFESRVKRIAGVKDSGNLIPGHGGVLDRIDSMTAAAPVFVLAWQVWRQYGGSPG